MNKNVKLVLAVMIVAMGVAIVFPPYAITTPARTYPPAGTFFKGFKFVGDFGSETKSVYATVYFPFLVLELLVIVGTGATLSFILWDRPKTTEAPESGSPATGDTTRPTPRPPIPNPESAIRATRDTTRPTPPEDGS